jgi:hypothetical protein
MKTAKFVAVCAAIGMGVTLVAESQQVTVAPSQGAGGSYSVSLQGKVVKGMPYSAEVENESVQTLSDGNKIVRKTTGRIYRDVEGRTRKEDDRPGYPSAVTISDPLAKLSWTLIPGTKTARETPTALPGTYSIRQADGTETRAAGVGGTRAIAGGGGGGTGGAISGGGAGGTRMVAPTPMPAQAGGGTMTRRSSNTVEENLPNKSIENLLCTGIRRTTTIPAGQIGNEQAIKIVSEEWTSIDLQVLVLTDLTDPRTGRSTYKLLNVRRTEPDATLFKVPADYTITRGVTRGGDEK